MSIALVKIIKQIRRTIFTKLKVGLIIAHFTSMILQVLIMITSAIVKKWADETEREDLPIHWKASLINTCVIMAVISMSNVLGLLFLYVIL